MHLFNRKHLIAAACLLALSACRTAVTPTLDTPGTPTADTPGTPTPDSADVATKDNTAEPTELPENVTGPGDFALDPLAGLADRPYTAALSVAFAGTQAGQPVQWTDTMELITRLDPPARALTVMTEGEPDSSGFLAPWSAEVDGITYSRTTEGQCVAAVIPADRIGSDIVELATLLPGVAGAEETGTETIDGVDTAHYAFDQRALGAAEGVDAAGELWIAADNTLVRYTLTVEAGPEYFGEGRAGTITYAYTLSEAQTIEIPEDCPAGLIDIARMPDAASVRELPGATTYRTPSDVAVVAAHYQEQLAGSGWEPTGEPLMTETTALLDYTQGDQQLSILLSVVDDITIVQLVIVPILPVAVPAITPTPSAAPQ
jgi:hypothetical protein